MKNGGVEQMKKNKANDKELKDSTAGAAQGERARKKQNFIASRVRGKEEYCVFVYIYDFTKQTPAPTR